MKVEILNNLAKFLPENLDQLNQLPYITEN